MSSLRVVSNARVSDVQRTVGSRTLFRQKQSDQDYVAAEGILGDAANVKLPAARGLSENADIITDIGQLRGADLAPVISGLVQYPLRRSPPPSWPFGAPSAHRL